jgi:hypothetical protein
VQRREGLCANAAPVVARCGDAIARREQLSAITRPNPVLTPVINQVLIDELLLAATKLSDGHYVSVVLPTPG